jgi:hypothetical protein
MNSLALSFNPCGISKKRLALVLGILELVGKLPTLNVDAACTCQSTNC